MSHTISGCIHRYWWGSEYCDADTYKQAWNYTRWYFNEQAGLKNIIYVYAPAKVSETEDMAYNLWYPGTDQVDIIGFDRYFFTTLLPALTITSTNLEFHFKTMAY